MYATIKVRIDGRVTDVCFASREDAERFRAFAETYHLEGGADRRAEAYLTHGQSMGLTPQRPHWAKFELERARLLFMLGHVLCARLAAADVSLAPHSDKLGANGPDGVTFPLAVADLPPRQRPAVGDMCRALTGDTRRRFETGLVVADLGDELEIIGDWSLGMNGSYTPTDLRHRVKVDEVMKIHSWLAK